jgi:farnesyl-diphosphate farnesyltransferase
LPKAVRPQIGLAYLLARTTDTVADTGIIPLERRLEALQALRERILQTSTSPLNFAEFAKSQASPAERALLERSEEALTLLKKQRPEDAKLIAQVLDIITSGQELDLRRFSSAAPDNIIALSNEAELDDYTYRVAGCVGEFWTRICRVHLFPEEMLDDGFLITNGIRFGKGLQLTNILRDLPQDLRSGRCYLPGKLLAQGRLSPADLLDPANEGRFRPVYDEHLELAESELRAGWNYTLAIPSRQVRVRLACAWPILIGLETIRLLHHGQILEGGPRIKVSRASVRRILWRSIALYPFKDSWSRLPGPAG